MAATLFILLAGRPAVLGTVGQPQDGAASFLGAGLAVMLAAALLPLADVRPRTRAGAPAGDLSALALPLLESQARVIAREVNRARRLGRPLSVGVMRCDAADAQPAELVECLIRAGLRETDIWTYDPRHGDIVVVAPETDHRSAELMMDRVGSHVRAFPEVRVTWSVATFPDEGLTFEALLEGCHRAERVSDWNATSERAVVVNAAGGRDACEASLPAA